MSLVVALLRSRLGRGLAAAAGGPSQFAPDLKRHDTVGGIWDWVGIPNLSIDGPRWQWLLCYDAPPAPGQALPPSSAFVGWLYANETFLPFFNTARYRVLTPWRGNGSGAWYSCEEDYVDLHFSGQVVRPKTWVWAEPRAAWEVLLELDAGKKRCETVSGLGCGSPKLGLRRADYSVYDLRTLRQV